MKNKNLLILPLVFIGLLTGILTGWFRIGWNLPFVVPSGEHGALMIGSFLGTLIALERSVSFPNKAALLVPVINSLSIIFFIAETPKIAYVFLMLGGLGMCTIYYIIYMKHGGIHILIMLAGAMCYLIGNAVLFSTSFYPNAVMWWIAFLFFTITGERLELSRFVILKNVKLKQNVLLILLALLIAGIFQPFHTWGGAASAISLIGCAIWLLKFDMAKHSLKKPGQSFYSGLMLTTGYIWLIISGILFAAGILFGLFYDASLHAFFLGFVFMMIFAHAPVILPAVLKFKLSPFGKSLYVWYAILNISLIMRILAVFPAATPYKDWAGMINGIAILGFFVNIIAIAVFTKPKDNFSVNKLQSSA
ncbi:MAG: hypothetical protein IT280_05675 [Ignavibacteria bacterium]|nr:hypothetical protein [Ignavibacteria bacterium]